MKRYPPKKWEGNTPGVERETRQRIFRAVFLYTFGEISDEYGGESRRQRRLMARRRARLEIRQRIREGLL